MFRRLLIVSPLLLMPSLVKAQGAYYQLAPAAPGTIVNGVPTQIYVCPLPDGGSPCPFPTSIYGNSTLTTPLSNPAVLTASGQFAFWTMPGQNTVQITAPYNIRKVVNIGSRGANAISTPVTSPNPEISKVDTQFASPDIDIRNYGAVAIFTSSNALVNGGYTINLPKSSTTGTLNSSNTGLAKGNWLFIPGAGAANPIGSASAPTVMPSVAVGPTGTAVVANAPSGGSTNYAYKVVWVDKSGGYTAASSAGITSTGSRAGLGLQSVTVSSVSQSNNVLTITTAARIPEVFTPSQLIVLQLSNGTGTEYYNVASVPNNTSITVTQGIDTRNGGVFPTASYASGTLYYWNCNHLILGTPPTNGWQALIYGRTSGSYTLLGITGIYDSHSGYGTYWDDYGSTMMASPTVPVWAPSSPPSAAVNDALSAQITAISGTSVTLGTASGSGSGYCGTGTCSAAMVLLDNGPPITAAVNASCNGGSQGGTVYIPTTGWIGKAWPVQSFTDLSHACNGSGNISIIHSSPLYLNGTIDVGNAMWLSDVDVGLPGGSSFGFTLGAQILVGHAYPAFFADHGRSFFISGTQFSNPANLYIDLLSGGSVPTGIMKNFGIAGGGSSDYMGIPLVFEASTTYQATGVSLQNFSISTGPNQVTSTSTPLIWNQAFGEFAMRDFFLNRRGYYELVGCLSGNELDAESNMERQGGITPMFMFQAECNGSGFSAKIHNQIQDTETVPLISHLTGPGGNTLSIDLEMDTPGSVSGYPIFYITVPNNRAFPAFGGQSTSVNDFFVGYSIDGVFNSVNNAKNSWNAPQGIGTGYSLFMESLPSTVTLTTPTSGGSLNYVSTGYTVTVAPVFNEAGRLAEGTPSPASNSETVSSTCPRSGNCMLRATWTAVTGAVGYDLYLNGVAVSNTIGAFTGTSASIAARGSSSAPTFSGGGPVGMNVNGMWVNSNPVAQTIASGTVSLETSPIASNTCASVVTATAPGVLTTDNIQADFNSNPTSTLGYKPGAMLTIIKYPTAGGVNFLVCNNTANSVTPGAVTLNWRVVR